MVEAWIIAPISALISMLAGVYFYYYVKRQDSGTEKMQEISLAIKEGAKVFIRREYTTLAIFIAIIATLLLVFLPPIWQSPNPLTNLKLPIAYIFGAVCSALAGYLGLSVATSANAKVAQASKEGLNKAFPIGFRGGAVMGLSVVGIGLLGVSIVYWVTSDPSIVLGYSFGASTISLFAKAGGGIYTKTADISADLVGKVELGIPEDDPRNPAVIADNVGDNVGDVAGMGADLFDSYVASIVAVMILGVALDSITNSLGLYVQIPLVFAGLGILSSIIGAFTVRVSKKGNPGNALNMGTYITCTIFGVLTYFATYFLNYDMRIWGAAIIGLVTGIIIGITSNYFTSEDKAPVKKTAEAAQSGAAITIITGFSYGLYSVLLPLVGIAVAVLVSYKLCEPLGAAYSVSYAPMAFAVFGIAIASLGMLSIVGLTVSSDAYGPIVDNSRGIAEQAGLSEEVIAITDELDSAGTTAKAITKGFAIGAAGLTVISLLAAFQEIVRKGTGQELVFDVMNPLVLMGTLIGIAIPAIFSGMVMLGVSRNASRMVSEIRRQFREIPGLKEGTPGVKPDYARCIDIATKGSLQELLPASAIVIGTTLGVGFVGGIKAMGGYLVGAILSSLLLALLMGNAGGLWDNAKKLIETGAYGGKGSEAHKAAVVGDMVGDPFKDTAGPSLNTVITVMSLIASLFAVVMVNYNLLSLLGVK
ncbi:sodium-translocating pyrophosphatase [Candidatus Bathyarchaeota archaeon]|nr:sodium-translocating pyrophosphatase [Candidatus Bathyarchaeota archaeon]